MGPPGVHLSRSQIVVSGLDPGRVSRWVKYSERLKKEEITVCTFGLGDMELLCKQGEGTFGAVGRGEPHCPEMKLQRAGGRRQAQVRLDQCWAVVSMLKAFVTSRRVFCLNTFAE